ncbi:hypothetical protein C0989_005423 [Termitomyces sp. Mn162]|nr:hypothetical protein C0989_005423 [Termitomyces sp. Mn162]
MPPSRYYIELPTPVVMGDQAEDARIVVMTAILLISLFAVSFPGLSKRLPFLKISHLVFFIGKHFGTGVILATAFCHLLPDAFASLQKPDVDRTYNGISKWTGLIILGSILAIFLVEYISTSFVDHLHSKPSAPTSRVPSASPSRSKSPLRPTEAIMIPAGPSSELHLPTPIPCGSRNCVHAPTEPTERTPLLHTPTARPRRERARSLGNIDDDALLSSLIFLNAPRLSRGGSLHSKLSTWSHEEACVCHMRVMHAQAHEMGAVFDDDEHEAKEDMTRTIGRKRQVVGILILQLGIMIHSLVIGLTLAITSGVDFTSLVTAIIFHQLFEGLSLGIRIAGLPPSPTSGPRWLAPTLSILFAITTPLGMVVGMLAFPSTRAGDSDLTQGLMAAISAGMLIYVSTVEMLAGDFVFGDVGGNHGHGHGHGHGHDHGRLDQQDEDERKGSAVRQKVLAVSSLLTGAMVMALVGLGE